MANGNGLNIGGLGDPLIVLGGLWWAGNNKRKFTGGMDGVDILAGGFGASSAQWAGEQVMNLTGGDTLTPLLSQALAGAAVSEFGDPIPENEAMARGIHLNVAQQAFSDAGFSAGQLIGDLGLGGIVGGNGDNGGDQTQAQNVSDDRVPSNTASDVVVV